MMNLGDFTLLKDGEQLEVIEQQEETGLKGYEFLQTIGKGGFSLVYIVRCKSTMKLYALKTMNKATIK